MRTILTVAFLLWSSYVAGDTYALIGTVVTPDRILSPGAVVVRDGIITAVADRPPEGVRVVETGGIILPGLIDLHNHLTWNFQPRWSPKQVPRDRFDWIASSEYIRDVGNVHYKIAETLACDEERYGEIKALVNGATAINGSLTFGNDCAEGLIRNLDVASGLHGSGVNKEPVAYEVFPFELDPARADSIRADLAAKAKVAFFHLAEGVDASAQRELRMLDKQRLLVEGVTIIHGTALQPSDFKTLADRHVGLVWSPRSNVELYGRTTDVRSAKAAGVAIAIAPDWSISGSDGMLDELRYANGWNKTQGNIFSAQELVTAATTTAARLAGVGTQLGKIAPGLRADLLIIEPGDNAYDAILSSGAQKVRAVIVNGRPLTGVTTLVQAIAPGTTFESFDLCGTTRSIDLSDADGGRGATLKDTAARLQSALQTFSQQIAPLTSCH